MVEPHKNRKMVSVKRVLEVLLLILFVIPVLFVFLLFGSTLFCRQEWSVVRWGLSLDQTKELLGKPIRDCDPTKKPPRGSHSECLEHEYAVPPDMPTDRALVYLECGKVFYVFLDENGKVAKVWWGGS